MNSTSIFALIFAIIFSLICLQSVNSASTRPRPIRDFIDYNAREDGDEIIALPSGGPQPSYARPQTIGVARGPSRRNPHKGVRVPDEELMFRDESSPGGRRGY